MKNNNYFTLQSKKLRERNYVNFQLKLSNLSEHTVMKLLVVGKQIYYAFIYMWVSVCLFCASFDTRSEGRIYKRVLRNTREKTV